MSVSTFLQKISAPFRGLSPGEIVGLMWYGPENLRELWALRRDRFDRQYGTETTNPVAAADLHGVGEHGDQAVFYWPTDAASFHRMMQAVAPAIAGSTFVDIGCGKGRVLLMAADYPFARIVGVDFSARLCEVAERNVQLFRAHRPDTVPIDVVCADATTYELPEGPLVVYLFDPFGADVMGRFAEHVSRSLERRPRPCLIVYRTPAHAEHFERRRFTVWAKQGRNWRLHHPWTVFRHGLGTDNGASTPAAR